MYKKILVSLSFILCLLTLSGCAFTDMIVGEIRGELIGRDFKITTYDNNANKTLNVVGDKVTVGLMENNANYSDEDGFASEVLEVTVNGNQMLTVGNTIIFAEKGLDMVTDFELRDVNISDGGGFVPFDRIINEYANLIGKNKTIIISSQLGIPIGVYQGDEVYVEIPDNLPKMTLLNIDGKALYIHRANYTIIDSNMLE